MALQTAAQNIDFENYDPHPLSLSLSLVTLFSYYINKGRCGTCIYYDQRAISARELQVCLHGRSCKHGRPCIREGLSLHIIRYASECDYRKSRLCSSAVSCTVSTSAVPFPSSRNCEWPYLSRIHTKRN